MATNRITQSSDAPTQCLHLHPSGERCSRPALEDGFCERHGPDATWRFAFTARRKIAAIFLAAAILWPILLDLYRALHH